MPATSNGKKKRTPVDRIICHVDPGAEPGPASIVGEVTRRTENILQVETADGKLTVEVPDSATVEIASIAGKNRVE